MKRFNDERLNEIVDEAFKKDDERKNEINKMIEECKLMRAQLDNIEMRIKRL